MYIFANCGGNFIIFILFVLGGSFQNIQGNFLFVFAWERLVMFRRVEKVGPASPSDVWKGQRESRRIQFGSLADAGTRLN